MKVLFVNNFDYLPNWGGRAATIGLRLMIRRVGGDIFRCPFS